LLLRSGQRFPFFFPFPHPFLHLRVPFLRRFEYASGIGAEKPNIKITIIIISHGPRHTPLLHAVQKYTAITVVRIFIHFPTSQLPISRARQMQIYFLLYVSKNPTFPPMNEPPREHHAHNPRNSRSCASMAGVSKKRRAISNSKGTGRLQNSQISVHLAISDKDY
jgi:hypothetical protein